MYKKTEVARGHDARKENLQFDNYPFLRPDVF